MNTSQLNGALLGNGTPDNRSFLTLVSTVVVTTTARLSALFALVGATLARATAGVLMTGRTDVTGSTTAAATSTVALQALSPNYITATTLGSASSSVVVTRKGGLTGSASGVATSGVLLSSKVALAMSTTAQATTTVHVVSGGKPAPADRTIWLANEPRTMVVY